MLSSHKNTLIPIKCAESKASCLNYIKVLGEPTEYKQFGDRDRLPARHIPHSRGEYMDINNSLFNHCILIA